MCATPHLPDVSGAIQPFRNPPYQQPAATDAIATGDSVAANYHFAWFHELSAPAAGGWGMRGWSQVFNLPASSSTKNLPGSDRSCSLNLISPNRSQKAHIRRSIR